MKTRRHSWRRAAWLFPLFSSGAWLILAGWLSSCARQGSEHGWVALFDGRSTAAFRGFHMSSFPTNGWTVQEGALKSLPGRGVDLVTREQFKDFELEFDWKASRGANSGIMYGVTEAAPETYWSGPEMQINDDPNHSDGRVPKTSAGALYDLIAPNDQKQLKPTGEYNHVRVVSRGGHIEHWLNGAKILEYDWNSPSVRALIQASKFKDAPYFMKELNGHIALQHHGDEVWFRQVRIRPL